MRILLTNDDGIRSPGLAVLRRALDGLGDVVTIAPDRNLSAVARAITIERALGVEPVTFGDGWQGLAVDGTPVDCVRVALLGAWAPVPDAVVAGINLGGNMGHDVTYSGTVGAAFEGALRGLPAIAVSVDTGQPAHLDEAVELLHVIVGRALTRPLAPRTVLNITLPDLPRAEIKGVRAAALGGASCHDRLLVQDGGRSGEYHIVCERPEHAPWPASDFEAVAGGYIALTPLRYDLVDESALAELDDWGRDV